MGMVIELMTTVPVKYIWPPYNSDNNSNFGSTNSNPLFWMGYVFHGGEKALIRP